MSLTEKLQREREEGREQGLQEALQRLIASGMDEREVHRILQLPPRTDPTSISELSTMNLT